MRTLKRNQQPIWYCLYEGKVELKDSDGNYTGEQQKMYAAPQKVMANVSPATGQSNTEIFGNLQDYDHVVVVDWEELSAVYSPNDYDGAITSDWKQFGVSDIDENTVLFFEKEPEDKTSADGYNYVIRRIAKSLNSIAIAISRVDVSPVPGSG